jgi:hypothetical protein
MRETCLEIVERNVRGREDPVERQERLFAEQKARGQDTTEQQRKERSRFSDGPQAVHREAAKPGSKIASNSLKVAK